MMLRKKCKARNRGGRLLIQCGRVTGMTQNRGITVCVSRANLMELMFFLGGNYSLIRIQYVWSEEGCVGTVRIIRR